MMPRKKNKRKLIQAKKPAKQVATIAHYHSGAQLVAIAAAILAPKSVENWREGLRGIGEDKT